MCLQWPAKEAIVDIEFASEVGTIQDGAEARDGSDVANTVAEEPRTNEAIAEANVVMVEAGENRPLEGKK